MVKRLDQSYCADDPRQFTENTGGSLKMENEQRCPHCGTTETPTDKLRDGECYIFCERCKKTITHDELLEMGVEEQRIDVNMTYYYDSEKNHVIVEMEDWKKILKILKATGAEVILPVLDDE